MLVGGPNGETEVPKRQGRVRRWSGGVVVNDPGKDGVLGDVVEGTVGAHIEVREVLKVGNLGMDPLFLDFFCVVTEQIGALVFDRVVDFVPDLLVKLVDD